MDIISWVALAVGLLVLFGIYMFVKPASQADVTLRDLRSIFDALKNTGSDGSFAALIADDGTDGRSDGVALQFSIENGKTGFDWVLINPANVADESRFLEFAKSQGFTTQKYTANGVDYHRSEDGDSLRLCESVLSRLYHVTEHDKLLLIEEGFRWIPDEG